MKVDAPAKINLGLHVLRRRSDGYHDIETVMVRVGWSDTIEAESARHLSMTCNDPDLPVDSGNLCLRAAIALATRFGVQTGARLRLTKRIPAGAGLGGGSSDAASTLRLLSKLWQLSPTPNELNQIAASLGSDIPFFLGPSPAIASGRGERLSSLVADDGGPVRVPFSFVVVKPKPSVSTVDAYQWVRPSDRDRVDLVDLVRSCNLERWRKELTNDFEPPVSARVPEIAHAKAMLLSAGAGYAAMSGSGSAVFGVFEREGDATAAQDAVLDAGHSAWTGRAEDAPLM